MSVKKKPLVVVTRKLPDSIETRMRELFDARLNLDDAPLTPEQIAEAVRTADVLVTNIRPAAMARLGLDYPALRAVNPRLVYAAVLGYAQSGPYAPRPAYDDLMQGAAGIAHLQSRTGDGTPRYAPLAMADRITGLVAMGAVNAALVHRDHMVML